jgi:dephospho-CoA kinase
MGKLILYRIFGRVFKNILTGKNVMMIDAPLLYETKILEHLCYPVVVVGCSEAKQIQRLTSRDGYT